MCDHLFVVTGGPGSGKTSLIEALALKGIQHMPEAGRAIIQDQVRIKGNALPWADRSAFAELMLGWELRSHREASAMAGPVLMDRSILDVIGYLSLCGLPIPGYAERAARLFRYNRRVFIAPFWDAIFSQDDERKQDKGEAEATYRIMAETYSRLGYDLVHLPLVSIEERAVFVLEHIGNE
ncbi:MAG: ATPase [Mesorhizobium sp.]|uniref:AAA family ATPase n=1 Tax=Mesorhizobium sp. TaxID=1871066 RepID=UPI000FE9D831|nr:MAG: ATPase [Mesorhizobium sp.]TIV68337.1 MAG: ATPase [Mesorhizobium sp.]